MNTQRKSRSAVWIVAVIAILLLAAGAFGFLRAGIYNVAADDPHYPMTSAALTALRDASIKARAQKLVVPDDLMSEARFVQGAGNYDAMCTQCHLAPGMDPTELSRGLYPAPPNLTRERVGPAEAFWVIKHGIKASGMPAWGNSMADEYVWNMAAFIQRLPELDEAGYRAFVDRSGGHSHGGGESDVHGDTGPAPMPDAHEEHATPHPESSESLGDDSHTDAPGTPPHAHPPKRKPKAPHVDAPGTPAHKH